MRKLAIFSLLLLSAGAAFGSTKESSHQTLDVSRSFQSQHDAIIKALGDGETYSEISADDLQVVRQSLNRLAGLVDGVQSVEQLPEETRVRVFNEQERVNTLLTRAAADSRMVCRREKPTGSNRPSNICLTVAERRRHRDAANDFFRNNPRAQGPVNNP